MARNYINESDAYNHIDECIDFLKKIDDDETIKHYRAELRYLLEESIACSRALIIKKQL